MTKVVHMRRCKININFVVLVIVFLKHLVCGLGDVFINSLNINYVVNDSNIENIDNKQIFNHSSPLLSNKVFDERFKEKDIDSSSLTKTKNNYSNLKEHEDVNFHPHVEIIKNYNSLKTTNLSPTLDNTLLPIESSTEGIPDVYFKSNKIGIEKSLLIPIVPAQKFQHAAVSTDNAICSDVGRNILRIGGTAVDASIAALLCLGTVNFQSSGLGGGGSMVVYKKETNEVDSFDFCEEAPSGITAETFDATKAAISGGLSVGVPGEIRGFEAAWRLYGRLSWKKLVQPSIDLAYSGFPISNHLYYKMIYERPYVFLDPGLRELLTYSNGTLKEKGTIIRRTLFAKTLEILQNNPEDFYEGNLAKQIVEDVQKRGGVLTLDDMKAYRVKRRKPVSSKIRNTTVYTTYQDGGPILLHILNINKGYNFSAFDVDSVDKQILTYHRIIESFKFSYAYRKFLGDPDDPIHREEINNAIIDLLNPDLAENHRQLINDSYTQNHILYRDMFDDSEEQGTTHVSVLAENGDAVSTTSSINFPFGSKFLSTTTGMVFNNVMLDFGRNGKTRIQSLNEYAGTSNAPGPKKRPRSGKCPTIIVREDGNVTMVIGAAGGNRIPLSIALVIMRKMWFGIELGEAVIQSRPAHVFYPDFVQDEFTNPLPSEIVEGLEAKGHIVQISKNYNVIHAIYRGNNETIYAVSDPRKGGKSSGY